MIKSMTDNPNIELTDIEKEQADSLPEGENRLLLVYKEEGLTLTDGTLSLRGDFAALHRRIRRDNLNRELLVRAVRRKGLPEPVRVLDATAGLGEDSFLLAAAGCRVVMYEQNPVIAALVQDALERAANGADRELAEIASRMTLRRGDSIAAMQAKAVQADVIFLDPMFPERQKSALVKKKFQLLHYLEKPCADQEIMLKAAMAAGPETIVIKRPLKGPELGGIKPLYSLKGKAIRYDCIIPPKPGTTA